MISRGDGMVTLRLAVVRGFSEDEAAQPPEVAPFDNPSGHDDLPP